MKPHLAVVRPVEPESTSAAAWNRLLRLMDEKPLLGFAGKLSRDERSERN